MPSAEKPEPSVQKSMEASEGRVNKSTMDIGVSTKLAIANTEGEIKTAIGNYKRLGIYEDVKSDFIDTQSSDSDTPERFLSNMAFRFDRMQAEESAYAGEMLNELAKETARKLSELKEELFSAAGDTARHNTKVEEAYQQYLPAYNFNPSNIASSMDSIGEMIGQQPNEALETLEQDNDQMLEELRAYKNLEKYGTANANLSALTGLRLEDVKPHFAKALQEVADMMKVDSSKARKKFSAVILSATEIFTTANDVMRKALGAKDKGDLKLAGREDFDEMLKAMDHQELMDFLGTLEAKELTPAQQQRMEQLSLMKTLLSVLSTEFAKGGKTWTLWAARLIGSDYRAAQTAESFAVAADKAINQSVTKVLRNPTATLDSVASDLVSFFRNPPKLAAMVMSPVNFRETNTEADLNRVRAETIQALRDLKHYSEAGLMASNILNPYLEKAKTSIPSAERSRIKNHIALEVYSEPRYSKMKAEAIEQGIPAEGVNKYLDAIIVSIADAEIKKAAAAHIDEAKLPPGYKEVWAQYSDMYDPKGELGNLSDWNKDFIIEELCINGALILACAAGGAGVGVLAGRLTTTLSVEALSFMRATPELARFLQAGVRGYEIAATVGRGLEVGLKMGAEAIASEFFNQGVDLFRNEKELAAVLAASPTWTQNILWNMISMGTFKGADRYIGDFTPDIIRSVTSKIGDEALQKLANELMFKGQIEAGVELIVTAIRKGLYEGKPEELVEKFGEVLYSSYVQTQSGVGTETLMGSAGESIIRAAL